MRYDGGPFFPLVIELRTTNLVNTSSTTPSSVSSSSSTTPPTTDSSRLAPYYVEQVQTTLCSIERSTDQSSSTLILKPLKQKLITNGVVYLLQELFGLENKEPEVMGGASSGFSDCSLDMDTGGECIICMANARDTVILPCRHCCICNGCAETLRYKLNNCPICRSPFKALLKLKTLRSVPLPTGTAGTIRMRQEVVPLMEALNGPPPQQQSCRGESRRASRRDVTRGESVRGSKREVGAVLQKEVGGGGWSF